MDLGKLHCLMVCAEMTPYYTYFEFTRLKSSIHYGFRVKLIPGKWDSGIGSTGIGGNQ